MNFEFLATYLRMRECRADGVGEVVGSWLYARLEFSFLETRICIYRERLNGQRRKKEVVCGGDADA